jgi:hypothetical protein
VRGVPHSYGFDTRLPIFLNVKVIYVENCPMCACALVREADGERRSSSRLKAACNGCACHGDLPIAAGT